MKKYCEDCKEHVEGVVYNKMAHKDIYVCEECGQFLNEQPTLSQISFVDNIASFGAWLVDNHEDKFNGGEIEIAELCSQFVEQHDKNKSDGIN